MPRETESPGNGRHALHRWPFLILGFLAVGVALIGVVVPLLPTTPFLIVAAWCFARSSQRFHDWLYGHRLFGKLLLDWDRHRIIPTWAKLCACTAMAASFTYIALYRDLPIWVLAVTAACLIAIAVYILSKPGRA